MKSYSGIAIGGIKSEGIMSELEIENKLNLQNYIEPEMVEAAFEFWFKDYNHVRSPFPFYIRENLRLASIDKFLSWSHQISDKAKKEINDEILAEKFEEIIFELAFDMVLTEDEKLTIRYPFMLRIGDTIKIKDVPDDKAKGKVIDRWCLKRSDFAFMKVKVENIATGEIWETEFELPE